MDIGGTKARIYEFQAGRRFAQLEIELPPIDSRVSEHENGKRRVEAISRLVKYFASERQVPRVATACAGLKDPDRTSVTLLHFGVPLPNLTQSVAEETGTSIGPLYDDDVAAAWGHLVSPISPLGTEPLNTLILTAGTGLAEAHWIDGRFVDKKSYPSASELGLERQRQSVPGHLRVGRGQTHTLPPGPTHSVRSLRSHGPQLSTSFGGDSATESTPGRPSRSACPGSAPPPAGLGSLGANQRATCLKKQSGPSYHPF